ncbi:MAG: hypothetical protein EA344_10330 [Alkalicoccus sp.]|nr:MAG: hypothetical protein EA344_10330 [Alkalicoccus sp.]
MDLLKLRVVFENHLGIGFTEERTVFMKKRSGNRRTPVKEGDWKIPQGVGTRKLKISSTASLPVGREVFLQPSTVNIAIF